jgi:hypothetical protein
MKSSSRGAAQTVLGAAGSLGLLVVAGWTAADPAPDAPHAVFTLAPIMATRSNGSGRPDRATVRHKPAGQVAVAR